MYEMFMRKMLLLNLFLLMLLLASCTQKPVSMEKPEGKPMVVSDDVEISDTINPIENNEKSIENNDESTPIESTGSIKEFEIIAYQFGYEPDRITVDEGDTVRIKLTARDVAHGFSIPEFGVNARADPRTPANIEFVASKAGTYSFKCSVPGGSGHKDMSGTLEVR